jgi:hypothetical protein
MNDTLIAFITSALITTVIILLYIIGIKDAEISDLKAWTNNSAHVISHGRDFDNAYLSIETYDGTCRKMLYSELITCNCKKDN